MRRTILVTLDGLRRDQISPDTTPNLTAFSQAAESFGETASVAEAAVEFHRAFAGGAGFPLFGSALLLVMSWPS